MKVGWKIKQLQSLCDNFKQDIVDGPFGSELQRKDYIAEGIPVLKIQNIKSFAIEVKKMDFVSPAKYQKLRRHSYRRGDIVMTKLGDPLGASAIVEGVDDGLIVADLVRIRAQRINTKYLCYHLNSQHMNDYLNSMQKGTTRPRIKLSVVRELPITVPPAMEQKRIVSILDDVFDDIATAKTKAQKNLQNAREIFESHLQIIFADSSNGWEKKTLSQVATYFGRGKSKHRPRNDKSLYGGRYPFIQTGDIRNSNHIITEYFQTYNDAGLSQSKLWPKGTICITIAANIAETGILGFDACFPDSVIGLIVNTKIADAGFVEYLLWSYRAKLQAKGKGAAQANINLATFENELFPFPSLSEQRTIVAKLDNLSIETKRIETIYQRKLANLDELKKSILQKAFNGDLSGAN